MLDLFTKGGVLMLPLIVLSIIGLAIFLHRYYLLLYCSLRKKKDLLLSAQVFERVQRGIDNLYLISSIAPLIGLLGTVFGIIKSFSVLSMTQPNSQILSAGLSEALFTTAAGLIIAIPCQIAGHFLQQKMDRSISALKLRTLNNEED